MTLEAGEIFVVSSGQYEMYGLYGLYRALINITLSGDLQTILAILNDPQRVEALPLREFFLDI